MPIHSLGQFRTGFDPKDSSTWSLLGLVQAHLAVQQVQELLQFRYLLCLLWLQSKLGPEDVYCTREGRQDFSLLQWLLPDVCDDIEVSLGTIQANDNNFPDESVRNHFYTQTCFHPVSFSLFWYMDKFVTNTELKHTMKILYSFKCFKPNYNFYLNPTRVL